MPPTQSPSPAPHCLPESPDANVKPSPTRRTRETEPRARACCLPQVPALETAVPRPSPARARRPLPRQIGGGGLPGVKAWAAWSCPFLLGNLKPTEHVQLRRKEHLSPVGLVSKGPVITSSLPTLLCHHNTASKSQQSQGCVTASCSPSFSRCCEDALESGGRGPVSRGAPGALHSGSLQSEAVRQTGPTWTAVKVPGRCCGLMGCSLAVISRR